MSDENALIPIEELAVQKYDDSMFDSISSSKYLPRVQLMTSGSAQCKSGAFPINHYALVDGKNYADLTQEVNCLVVAWRPKALRTGDEIISCYDTSSPEFIKIQTDSEVKDSGCMFGPEFLLYIPSENKYATFFMGSKSSRNESPSLKALMGKAATLASQHIQTKKYDWYAPKIVACEVPFDVPPIEEIKEQVETFTNPPESEVETVDNAEANTRER